MQSIEADLSSRKVDAKTGNFLHLVHLSNPFADVWRINNLITSRKLACDVRAWQWFHCLLSAPDLSYLDAVSSLPMENASKHVCW